MTIHVIGNACVDATFRVDWLPRPGETVNAREMAEDLGGKGLNQAVAARRAGADVHLWAQVGDDAAGERIASCLVAEGIGSAQLKRSAQPTDRSVVIVDRRGENMIVSDVGCARVFDPFAVSGCADTLARGDWLVLQGNLRPDVTKQLMSEGRLRGCHNFYNASPLNVAETIPLEVVEVLVVNLQEARALSGFDAPGDAMMSLFGGGAAAVVVTLGGDGVIYCDQEGSGSLPAHPVATIDTSGAGDVFSGVLVAGLERGFGLAAAVAWANRAAAAATTRPGTLSACPSRDELAELISQNGAQKEPI
jgi:ribokinase